MDFNKFKYGPLRNGHTELDVQVTTNSVRIALFRLRCSPFLSNLTLVVRGLSAVISTAVQTFIPLNTHLHGKLSLSVTFQP